MTSQPFQDNANDLRDLTFIGSGISTSFTIIPLLQHLKSVKSSKQCFKITIVEKSSEFHTGLAYGPRSGSSALLITSLVDFLPDDFERRAFINWLSINKKKLLLELESSGGDLSKNWIATHKNDIDRDDWEEVYIPRRFFGKYIHERTQNSIEEFNSKNDYPIEFIVDEVMEVNRENDQYKLQLKNSGNFICSKNIIVSVGIPPVNKLWSGVEVVEKTNSVCLIEDPYLPNFDENLDKIKTHVSNRNRPSNILIIGANASAMEVIYKLNDINVIKSKIGKIYVISPQGELPNSAKCESSRSKKFVPEHLLSLNETPNLTALQVYNAANKDLDTAEQLNYGTAITEIPVSKAFNALLKNLNAHELAEFACHYGNEIGKRQRRAGKHYTNVVDTLKSINKLENISGYFHGIVSDNKGGIKINYIKQRDAAIETMKDPVDVIVNCIGSKMLNQKPVSPLIDDLIKKGLCQPNASMRGFKVTNNFESSPGLYVMGPLLAGNIINSVPLWHIEHCGRIINLGKLLAKNIVQND